METQVESGPVVRLKRSAPLKISRRGYLTGFYRAVHDRLMPTARGSQPTPRSVYKVISDERPSRALLENVFVNCPELLAHPATSEAVRRLYTDWLSNGRVLAERYGRGGVVRAEDCI